MSAIRTNPYYVGRELRRHRPDLRRDMASLPDDVTVFLVVDGSDEAGRRLYRCVINKAGALLADERRHRTWDGAWEAARTTYEAVAA